MSYQLVDAGEGFVLSGTLRDAFGDPIQKADVSTITVTARDAATNQIVNGREEQNVLDANGGTMDAVSGAFRFSGGPADTEPLDADADGAEHAFSFRVAGTFAGEVLEFTHHVRCVETLLLCRFDHVKLKLRDLSDEEEPLIDFQIEAFTKLVENMTGRSLKRKVATEVLSPQPGSWTVRVSRWPICSITSVKEDTAGEFGDDALDAESYVIGPEGIIRRRWVPFLGGPGSVQVVFEGGLARNAGSAPADLRAAAVDQVVHAWTNRTTVGEANLLPHVERIIKLYAPRIVIG